jgi:hypothetical protein
LLINPLHHPSSLPTSSLVNMAPTPVPLPGDFDVGKSLNHAWKTLKPIMEWTSTIVDKGYMISDFLISKRQKGVDARYAFGKAEAEAYKILEAQQRDRHGKGSLERRSPGEEKEDKNKEAKAWSDPKEFIDAVKNMEPEEAVKWTDDLAKAITEEFEKFQAESEKQEKEETPTKKDKSS